MTRDYWIVGARIVDGRGRDPVDGVAIHVRDGRIGPALDGQVTGLLAARAAGVRVGSGSDLIGPRQRHRGRELTLCSAIETPMLALESATRVNAEILGIGAETGTIEVGKLADLTAWTTDPLTDPEVFADPGRVALVVRAGVLVKGAGR